VVAGRDGADCLLTWSGAEDRYRAIVLDLQMQRRRWR
jgi:hypothetical protein